MINNNSVIDARLSPSLLVKGLTLDCDNSLVIDYDIEGNGQVPDTDNHAFYWLIETWLKKNNIPYKFDRCKKAYATSEGVRIFGKEVTDIEWFINNL